MTKADIVTEISNKTGIDRNDVLAIVEGFMGTVKNAMENGENVYLRGFGSFIVKKRAEKLGRNILAKTSVVIPAHHIPAFKPAKEFMDDVKAKVKVDSNANA
ncbi:MAG: HU family DNA-binding protein [Flavobacteriales bacterium]|jgi:DNA-binding protein HU-beta